MVTELELLKKSDKKSDSETKNKFFTPQHFRYKKTLPAPQSLETENDNNITIKKCTKDLVSGKISSDDFKEALKTNGINPNTEAVKF